MKNLIVNMLVIAILTACSGTDSDNKTITLPKELVGKWKAIEIYRMYDNVPPNEYKWEEYNTGLSYDIEFKNDVRVFFYDVTGWLERENCNDYTFEIIDDHIYFYPIKNNDLDCKTFYALDGIKNDLLNLDEMNLKVLWRKQSLEFNETKYIKVE